MMMDAFVPGPRLRIAATGSGPPTCVAESGENGGACHRSFAYDVTTTSRR